MRRLPASRLPFLAVPALLVVTLAALLVLRDREAGAPVEVRSRAAEATFAFAEFGATADRVYVAPAANPADRRLVATIDHVEGWGINPAFSLAGSLAAYTVLAPGAEPRRDARAELWLLDLLDGKQTRLASDADLLAPPAFDAAGGRLVYRSTRPDGTQEIVRVELVTRLRTPVHTYRGPFGVFPIGFGTGSEVLLASLSPQGTDLFAVREGEAPRLVTHASDQIARDWRVSPDGSELSYLAPELLGERWVYRLRVVATEDGAARTLDATAAARAEHFGPVWTPDGSAVTVGREAYPGVSAPALTLSLADGSTSSLVPPAAGFDVPLGWSPNGRYLAARSFDGSTSYDPGRETIVVISADGERLPVSRAAELIFLGWVGSG